MHLCMIMRIIISYHGVVQASRHAGKSDKNETSTCVKNAGNPVKYHLRCYYEYHKFVGEKTNKPGKTYINHNTSMLKCVECKPPTFIRTKVFEIVVEEHPAFDTFDE